MHANETSTYFRDLVSRLDRTLHRVARNKFARFPVIRIYREKLWNNLRLHFLQEIFSQITILQ